MGDFQTVAISSLTQQQAHQELARLADILNRASAAYHRDDAPIMSDADFDALRRRNAQIEQRFPELVRQDSPEASIGAAPAAGFGKIRHVRRMLSLANAFSTEDVEDFVTGIRRFLGLDAAAPLAFTAEPKIDGLSLSLRYEKGALVYAATRGDGETGEDVTANARTLQDIPARLPDCPDILEIRGEVYMTHDDFAALNARQRETGNKVFANPAMPQPGRCASWMPRLHAPARCGFSPIPGARHRRLWPTRRSARLNGWHSWAFAQTRKPVCASRLRKW